MASGSFKSVYKATWKSKKVAVLVLRGGTDPAQEIGMFERIGRHPHLVKLLGVCIKPQSRENCMVMEFAERGSLDSVLHEIEEQRSDRPSNSVLLTAASQVGCSTAFLDNFHASGTSQSPG
jgi:serine/threonine protein kinase